MTAAPRLAHHAAALATATTAGARHFASPLSIIAAATGRCRTRSESVVSQSQHLAPRPQGWNRCYTTQLVENPPTYAASLATDFTHRRAIDLSAPLKSLRSDEQRLLQLAASIKASRCRGRDRPAALDEFEVTLCSVLDSLNAMHEPARILALRNPEAQAHVASLLQIRRTITRAGFREFVHHPLGLPYARRLLDRIWTDADAQDRVGAVDGDVLGMMIRRFRNAEADGRVWKLPGDPTHAEAFQTFLARVLTRLTTLGQDIFTLVMDIHVSNGMPIDALRPLIDKCMRISHEWNGRWTPAAFHVLMQAYRRDGDIRECIRVYRDFRSMIVATAADEPWNHYIGSTISWPYEAILTACLESRMAPVTKNKYRAPSSMPEQIWADIQHDAVRPPARLLAYLIKLARYSKDLQSAHRLWGIFFPVPSRNKALAHPDIDCYYQYLKLLRLQPSAKGTIIPLRKLVRQILERNLTAGQTTTYIRALWTQVLHTALSPPYNDLPLAHFVLSRFTGAGMPVDTETIDTAAECLLRYWKTKARGTHWTREVMGAEAAVPLRKRQMPDGVRNRNARARGVTTADWDLFSRRLASLTSTGDVTYLPLGKPFARWETPRTPGRAFQTRVCTANERGDVPPETLTTLHRAVMGVLERCITTRPCIGSNPYIQHAERYLPDRGAAGRGQVSAGLVLRLARESVYFDLFAKPGA